jgi:hypothetical protein
MTTSTPFTKKKKKDYKDSYWLSLFPPPSLLFLFVIIPPSQILLGMLEGLTVFLFRVNANNLN